MKRRVMSACWSSVLGLSVLLLCSPALFAQGAPRPSPTVRHAVALALRRRFRELAKLPAPPHYVLQANHPLRPSQRRPAGVVVDRVEQSAAGGGSNITILENGPGLGLDFSGFDTTFNYPDDNMAVGKDQIVQVVNNSVAVFDKSLNSLGSVSIDDILGQLGGDCAAGTPEGHPIAQYDRTAGRWLIAENVVSAQPYSGTACIAVSTSSDATGDYYGYEFSLGDGYPDLAKWGVMPTGFFQSNDNFGADGMTYQGAYECAYDRVTMEAGGDAAQVCFQLTTSDFALLPADLDSAQPPPLGQDEFLFSLWDSSNLALYSFHTDWSNPNNAFMTGSGGSQLFPVPAFTPACNGQYLGACVPQLGSPDLLDVLGDRLLYRVAYYDDVPPQSPGNGSASASAALADCPRRNRLGWQHRREVVRVLLLDQEDEVTSYPPSYSPGLTLRTTRLIAGRDQSLATVPGTFCWVIAPPARLSTRPSRSLGARLTIPMAPWKPSCPLSVVAARTTMSLIGT